YMLAILLAGHVQWQKLRVPAGRLDFFSDRATAPFIAIGDEDERASSRKSLGNRGADSRTSTRDQRDLVLETEHILLSAHFADGPEYFEKSHSGKLVETADHQGILSNSASV